MNAQFAGSGFSLALHGLAVLALLSFNAEIRLPPPPVPMDLAILHAPEPPPELPGPPDEPPPAPAAPEPRVAAPPEPQKKPVPRETKKPAPKKKPVAREKAPKPEPAAETPPAQEAAPASAPAVATAPTPVAGAGQGSGRGGSRGVHGGTYGQGEIDGKLVALKRAPPEYPASARRRNIEGWVKVRFIVNTHGQPEQIKILAAEPKDVFEANAERAVRGWRFRPGTVNGEVVRVLVEQTIRFQLR